MATGIVDLIQDGGITVAFYGSHLFTGQQEFITQADQFARDHRALGLNARGQLREGAAMELLVPLGQRLGDLNAAIAALLSRYPDVAPPVSAFVPVRLLAIFTHGDISRTSHTAVLEAKPQGGWVGQQDLRGWADQIAPYLSAIPRILLFACLTGGQPAVGLPFAEAMRQLLQEDLTRTQGPGAAPEVWGHETAGHTTRNPTLAEFSGPSSVHLLSGLANRLTIQSAERAGRGDVLTSPAGARQLDALRRAARQSIGRALGGEGGEEPRSPINVYIREIPSMGVERVWRDLTSQTSVDFSDLSLTPEAQARLRAGLEIFRGRLAAELQALERLVHGWPTSLAAQPAAAPAQP